MADPARMLPRMSAALAASLLMLLPAPRIAEA
jgi:hypothetical protein